jgi:hypothetical protein
MYMLRSEERAACFKSLLGPLSMFRRKKQVTTSLGCFFIFKRSFGPGFED